MTTRATQRAAATSAVAPLFGTAAALDHRTLLAAVATSTPAIRQPRRGAPITPDAQLQLAYEAQPRFFALAALSPSATDSQRAQILLALLASSRQTLDPAARSTCERVADLLVEALDASTVVDVLLALRRARTNHRHATRLAVRFTLAGDRAEDLVVLRPRAVRDIVEHALGARVARAAGAAALRGEPLAGRPRRLVVGSAEGLAARTSLERAARVLVALYGEATASADLAARSAARQRLHSAHLECAARLSPEVVAPQRVTAADRGAIAQTLHHVLRGGMTSALWRELSGHVSAAVAQLSRFAGHLALVVDASASTEGYGERRFCCIAQSMAAALVLSRVARQATITRVGGSERGGVLFPLGGTDLAEGVLGALEQRPDAVVVLTDGYENRAAGDLAALCATLPAVGVQTPVVVVTVTFTPHDDIGLRRPLAALARAELASPAQEMRLWHQDELWALLARTLSGVAGVGARDALAMLFERRLQSLRAC